MTSHGIRNIGQIMNLRDFFSEKLIMGS